VDQSTPTVAYVPDPKVSGFIRESVWAEYLQQIRSGDQDGLRKLYDEASPLLFSVALRILDSRADAEEVTLDVFHQIWKAAGSWDLDRGPFTTWMILLTRSRALDKLRWRKCRSGAIEVPDLVLDLLSSNEQNAEEVLEVQQQQHRVRTAMQQLTDVQRHALEVAFYQGLTHQEISDQLGEPLGTIKSRIRAAMLKMKETLGGLQWIPQ